MRFLHVLLLLSATAAVGQTAPATQTNAGQPAAPSQPSPVAGATTPTDTPDPATGAVTSPAAPVPPAFVPGIASPAQDKPRGPVRISGGVMAGNVVNKVDPVYPPDAKTAGLEGAVVFDALISKTGTVENLKVVSGPQVLASSAMDAVRQWTYRPYLLNGQPVEVRTTITVNFHLNASSATP